MSNVSVNGSGQLSLLDQLSGLSAAANAAAQGSATPGVQYLRFNKAGEWLFGAEQIEPEEGSRWAVNVNKLSHGWVCWNDGKKVGEIMSPAVQPLPEEPAAKNSGDDWKQQIGIEMQCTNGEDKDTVVMYAATSVGGKDAFAKLVQAIIQQVNVDPANAFPIVELGSDSYKHDKYGKIYKPELTVVGWFDGQDPSNTAPKTEKLEAPEADEEPAAAPRRRRRTA